MTNDEKPYVPPFIRRRMPDATEEEILEAAENLTSYLRVMYRIFREREERARAGLRSSTRERGSGARRVL